MHTVPRSEIVDYQTWTDNRDGELERILKIKAPRRGAAGEHLTFLFENDDTILWQVQEMMRVERIVREKDIQHELDTDPPEDGTTDSENAELFGLATGCRSRLAGGLLVLPLLGLRRRD